jgi:hypothetical protein
MNYHTGVNDRIANQVEQIRRDLEELRRTAELFSDLPDSPNRSLIYSIERLTKSQKDLFSDLGFDPDRLDFHLV